jgi:hypothetical protein
MRVSKEELVAVLSQFNPWWRDEAIADLPKWRRAAFRELYAWMTNPPAPGLCCSPAHVRSARPR